MLPDVPPARSRCRDLCTPQAPTDIRTVLTAYLAEMREVGVRTEVPADIWIDGSGLVRQTVSLFSVDDGTRVRVTRAYSDFGFPLRDIPDPAEVCKRLGANPDLRSNGRWDLSGGRLRALGEFTCACPRLPSDWCDPMIQPNSVRRARSRVRRNIPSLRRKWGG